jgi:thiosulfate:glutathione sulfurtransferase
MQIITTKEVEKIINSKEICLLFDNRTPEEFQTGSIPTAINIPVQEIENAFSLSSEDFKHKYNIDRPDEKMRIICFCRSGSRSEYAVEFLIQNGYKNVYNYQGSMLAWDAKK